MIISNNNVLHYLQLRYKIYYQQLKTMLSALTQFLGFLMFVLYLAIPAMFLSSLISVSVIADVNTTITERIIYQWLYFFLVFLLLKVQKSAILASQYHYFERGLLITKKAKNTATTLLTILAGNAPLLTPLLLSLLIPNVETLEHQLYFPLFAISLLVLSYVVIKQQNLPWFSLIILPAVVLLLTMQTPLLNHPSLTTSAILLNALCLAILIIEAFFLQHLSKLTLLLISPLTNISVRYYVQLRLLEIKQQLAPNLSRVLALLLITTVVVIFQSKMQLVANIPIQLLVMYLFSLIIGSYQFDNEAFYRKYHYYLMTLITSKKARYYYDSLAIALLVLLVLAVSILWLNFTVWLIIILPLATVITVLSVSRFPRNFFIPVSILMMLLLFVYFSFLN